MAKRGRKAGKAAKFGSDYKSLLTSLTDSIRMEVMKDLDAVIRNLSEGVRILEQKLTGKASNGRRGPKPRKTPGRKAASTSPKTAASFKRGRRRKTNAPAGALKAAVLATLQAAKKPLAMKDIHAAVMKTEHFIGRNAKSIYNKISGDLAKHPKVKRVGKGVYALKK